MNKIVARFKDGTIVKGSTSDFVPTKDTFHVTVVDAPPGSKPVPVAMKDLKALFFVRDFVGNPDHTPRNDFEEGRGGPGRRIRVVFADGEVLVGTTQAYQPGRPGFFLVPADQDANIERCYVVAASTTEVVLL